MGWVDLEVNTAAIRWTDREIDDAEKCCVCVRERERER